MPDQAQPQSLFWILVISKMYSLILIIFLSYLAGSIPTSIIISKVFFGFDIRTKGSGNAGGTNAFRVLGWKIGIIVMLVDIAKGIIATYTIAQLRIDYLPWDQVYIQMLAGIFAIIGHIWTAFADFRGGKGVGTAAGMLIVLYPAAVLICLVVFLIVLITSRYVSLSSLSAAVTLPLALIFLSVTLDSTLSPPLLILAVCVSILIIYTHRSNIQRLINGNENRIKKIL